MTGGGTPAVNLEHYTDVHPISASCIDQANNAQAAAPT